MGWYGPTDVTTGPTAGSSRVARGGYYHRAASYCRSAARVDSRLGLGFGGQGFRVSRVLAEEPEVKPAKPQPTEPGPATSGTEPAAPASTAGKTSPSNLPTNSKETSVELGGGVKLEMVLIPAGEFLMGSPASDKDAAADEKPQHRVRITKPFYIGKYLVTNRQWEVLMGGNPGGGGRPTNPVMWQNWDDCQQFIDKLNAKSGEEGGKFQLPTEAQWEYACRAGSTTRYFFGDDASRLGEYAWSTTNSAGEPHPVGEKKPNAWGLYDMHGYVWQWCQDWYDTGYYYYANSPADNPAGPPGGSNRVFRGGAWCDLADRCRSANRGSHAPSGATTSRASAWLEFRRTSEAGEWRSSGRRGVPSGARPTGGRAWRIIGP